MVSTTTADSLTGAAPVPADAAAAPRVRLRNALVLLLLVGVPMAWQRDPQLVWQPLLPIPLLFLSPRGASRVLAAFVAVLVVIGGGVTTYRVGMAVPDWPATFQQNMWTYPFSDMLAEGHGVTLEHAHRVWASGVGLVAICVLLTCYIQRAARGVTAMAWVVLLAIIGQGLLGGTRVLENSQNLAFLHGALALRRRSSHPRHLDGGRGVRPDRAGRVVAPSGPDRCLAGARHPGAGGGRSRVDLLQDPRGRGGGRGRARRGPRAIVPGWPPPRESSPASPCGKRNRRRFPRPRY